MLKTRYCSLITLAVLILIAACSSNKVIEEPVPVRNPLALAREAADEGNQYYLDGEFDASIIAFEKAVSLFEEAASLASEADSISLNIENMRLNIAKSFSDHAISLNNNAKHAEAVLKFENALRVYSSLVPVKIADEVLNENIRALYNNLAIATKNAGQFEKSLTYYDRILAQDPKNVEALNAKFFILSKELNDDEKAFSVLAEYARVSQDPSAYIMLGDNYSEKSNNSAAIDAYLSAMNLRPDIDIFTRLSKSYKNAGNWALSNTYLEKIAASNPEASILANVYAQMAENFSQLKNNTKRIEYLEKAFATERDSRIALVLASHYNGVKNWAKVISYATAVLQAEANNSDARMLRGIAYYQQKKYKEARADFERLTGDPKYSSQVQSLLKNMPK